MEPEGSLLSTQQPAICPNPEPDQSSQGPPSYILKIHFCINLPATSGSSTFPFYSTLLHQNLCVLFAYVLHAPAYLIILCLITRIVLGE